MNYDEINADEMMAEIDTAIAEGRSRRLTERELLEIRIAASESNAREMRKRLEQLTAAETVEDSEPVHAHA